MGHQICTAKTFACSRRLVAQPIRDWRWTRYCKDFASPLLHRFEDYPITACFGLGCDTVSMGATLPTNRSNNWKYRSGSDYKRLHATQQEGTPKQTREITPKHTLRHESKQTRIIEQTDEWRTDQMKWTRNKYRSHLNRQTTYLLTFVLYGIHSVFLRFKIALIAVI